MPALPCVGRTDVFDALIDHAAGTPAYRVAHAAAVRLCAACPMPCAQQVTADSGPRVVELLPDTWLPAVREGRPEPVAPPPRTWSADRRAGAAMTVGRSYVPPDRRVAHWAQMAAELAAAGMPLAAIAEHLCVTEDTARALLDTANHQAA